MPSSAQAAVVFPPRANHAYSSLGRILMLLVPILSTLSCPARYARRMVSSQHPTVYDGWRVQIFTAAAAKSAKSGNWILLSDLDEEAGGAQPR